MTHRLEITAGGLSFVGEVIAKRLDRAFIVLSDLGAGDRDLIEVGREGERPIVRGKLADLVDLVEGG